MCAVQNRGESGRGRGSNQPPGPNHVLVSLFSPTFHWSPAPSSAFGRITLPKLFHKHFGLQPPAKEECKGMMYKALIRPNYESWLRLLISRASTSAGEGGSDGEDSGREREKEGGGEGGRKGGRGILEESVCRGGRGGVKSANVKGQYVVTLSDVLLNVALKSSRHLITHG